jgi:hypothetical protein
MLHRFRREVCGGAEIPYQGRGFISGGRVAAAAGIGLFRPFSMSLNHEDGMPKLALEHFAGHTPDMVINQSTQRTAAA